MNQLLTAKDVARILRVHVNTVKRLTERGYLPCYRMNQRGDLRYREEDIEMYLAARYVAGKKW